VRDTLLAAGDPVKAASAFWRLSLEEQPPLYLPLGKDALVLVRNKIVALESDLNKYEKWSDDLKIDGL
jgi:hypothetical protein